MKLSTVSLLSATVLAAVVLSGLGAPLAAAEQQESYTFTLGLLGGLGGALDAEPDPGLGQTSWALAAGMVTAPRTLVVVRAGRLAIEGDPAFERFAKADLEYVNIAGEYRFAQPTYDYGTYIGLGYYQMKGDLLTGGVEERDAFAPRKLREVETAALRSGTRPASRRTVGRTNALTARSEQRRFTEVKSVPNN